MLGPFHPGLAHPKVPHAVDKREKRRTEARTDHEERRKVHARSGGRCEIYDPHHSVGQRCPARAVELHHLLGGIGRRNVGESIAAQNRVHLCLQHHRDVHDHVLRLGWVDDRNRAGTLTATRVR